VVVLVPFAYWTGPGSDVLDAFLTEWRMGFAEVRLWGDSAVGRVLRRLDPGWADLFDRIRLPAARADVARLAVLHRDGGLYLDCHCGLRDASVLRSAGELLREVEFVVWNRSRQAMPRPRDEIKPVNGVLFSRAGSPIALTLLSEAMHRLAALAEREREWGRAPFSVWSTCGAGMIRDVLVDPDAGNRRFRPAFAGRVAAVDEDDGPIELWRHHSYHHRASHWSRRQQHELLFDPV
jgi:hypothetical protein